MGLLGKPTRQFTERGYTRKKLYCELLLQGIDDESIGTIMHISASRVKRYFEEITVYYDLYRPTRQQVINSILKERGSNAHLHTRHPNMPVLR
jgi:hypothetical protein